MTETVRLSVEEVRELAVRVLSHNGMSDAHANAIGRVIAAGQRGECHFHGGYCLLVTTHTLRKGKVSCTTEPLVHNRGLVSVAVDAQHEFSQLAFDVGSQILVRKARGTGIAALAINRCYHFSALWPEVKWLAEQSLAALALIPSYAWVTSNGSRPALGTNPPAFGWPRRTGHPYVFDFATSAAAWCDKINLHRRTGTPIPLGWRVHSQGEPTTDPDVVAHGGAMLTFGSHGGRPYSPCSNGRPARSSAN